MHRCLSSSAAAAGGRAISISMRLAASTTTTTTTATTSSCRACARSGGVLATTTTRRRPRPRPRTFATGRSSATAAAAAGSTTGTCSSSSSSSRSAAPSTVDSSSGSGGNPTPAAPPPAVAGLPDLLRTLSARARDISARVPPPSGTGNRARTGTRAGTGARAGRPSDDDQTDASSAQPIGLRADASPQSQEGEAELLGGASWAAGTDTDTSTDTDMLDRTMDLNQATDAAGALLVLTASPALRRAFAARDTGGGGAEVPASIAKDDDPKSKASALLDPDTVESLHLAFLSVSAWLQSSIRAAAAAAAAVDDASSPRAAQAQLQVVDEAIVAAIDLTVRSADLALPLTATLYRTLAADVVAAHSSPSSHPPLQVMEVANLMRVGLFPAFNPPPMSFFHGPCVALVRRGMIREAIELLDEMDAEFGIEEVEAVTGMDMLSAVAEGMGLVEGGGSSSGGAGSSSSTGSKASIVFGRVGRGRSDADAATHKAVDFDPVDATELVFRLRGPLLRQLDDVSKQLRREMDSSAEGAEANAELVDLLQSLSQQPADSDATANADNDPDATSTEIDDGDVHVPSEVLEEYLEADSPEDTATTLTGIETLSDAVSSLAEDGTGPSPASAVSITPVHSTYQIPQSVHTQMVSEMIYIRKGPSWDLPDLAEQLRSLNNGKEIVYTRKYEEDLISTMMRDWEEDGEYDDFDYDDDDEEERER